jgi:hypothetical protein
VSGNLVGYSSIVARQIQNEITNQLKAKGLSEASADKAQLMVVPHVSGQRRVDVRGDYGYYGDTYAVRYVQGTLIIDIFDQAKKKHNSVQSAATRPAGRTGHARAVYATRPTSPGRPFAPGPTWLRRRAAECY